MEMDKNIHKVAKAQWKKWCEAARYVFNEMMAVDEGFSYGLPLAIQRMYGFYDAVGKQDHQNHLDTVKWNAAFNAACIVNDAVKENGADK